MIPQEILRLVFIHLDKFDLEQCQQVCLFWYLPAHLLFLKSIKLHGLDNIEQFVRSIDANKDPSYLNAVSTITINDSFSNQLDRVTIKKLILRFPNITAICLENESISAQVLDDRDICNEIVDKCTSIESIQMNITKENQARYYDLVYRMKSTITTIKTIENMTLPKGCSSIEEYLASFPHLNTLYGGYPFGKYLTIIEKLPNLKNFDIGPQHDRYDFDYRYLTALSDDQHDRLVMRLSQFTDIKLRYNRIFCQNAMKFVRQYLIGLTKLSLYLQCYNTAWLDTEAQVFYNNIVNTAYDMDINVKGLSEYTSVSMFKPIVQKLYAQSSKHNTLRLAARKYKKEHFYADDHINLSITTDSGSRHVEISYLVDIDHKTITRLFQAASPMNNLDTFILDLTAIDEYAGPVSYSECQNIIKTILSSMPTVKELVMDLTRTFCATNQTAQTQIFGISNLTLRGKPASLHGFGEYIDTFTDLKHLKIVYSCGLWDDDYNEYRLFLRGANLESLTVDFTCILAKCPKGLIVIDIQFESSNERRLYKVSNNLLDVAQLTYESLEEFDKLKDYTMVQITISSLQSLEIFGCGNGNVRNAKYYTWPVNWRVLTTVFDDGEEM